MVLGGCFSFHSETLKNNFQMCVSPLILLGEMNIGPLASESDFWYNIQR